MDTSAWGQDFYVYTLESKVSVEGTGHSGLGLEVLELENPLLTPACHPLSPFGAFDCWAGTWGQNNICLSTGAVVLPAFNLWSQSLLQIGPLKDLRIRCQPSGLSAQKRDSKIGGGPGR